jgi:hypothetical protein
MIKNPMSVKEILHKNNSPAMFSPVSPAPILDVSAGNSQRVLVDKSGMIRKSDGDAQ